MYHAMLYQREVLLNRIVYLMGDEMGFCQRHMAVCTDFHIHIEFVTEQPGLQEINFQYAWLLKDYFFKFFQDRVVTGTVCHFAGGFPENIMRER